MPFDFLTRERTARRFASIRMCESCLGASVITTLLGISSCSRVPPLTPQPSYVELRAQIKRANLIATGVVDSEHVVRTVIRRQEKVQKSTSYAQFRFVPREC